MVSIATRIGRSASLTFIRWLDGNMVRFYAGPLPCDEEWRMRGFLPMQVHGQARRPGEPALSFEFPQHAADFDRSSAAGNTANGRVAASKQHPRQ
jgi:hypothetical protein